MESIKLDATGQRLTNNIKRNKRRQFKKARLVALKGGRCERCGGTFHLSVYEFHHRNPAHKDDRLNSGNIGDWSWDRVLAEAEKTHLLCANCHREVHAFDDHRFLEYEDERGPNTLLA